MTVRAYLEHAGIGTEEQIRLSCGPDWRKDAKREGLTLETFKTLRHPALRYDPNCGPACTTTGNWPAIPSVTFYRISPAAESDKS